MAGAVLRRRCRAKKGLIRLGQALPDTPVEAEAGGDTGLQRTGAVIVPRYPVKSERKIAPRADPFRAIDRELTACGLKAGADAIIIDFHAEATSEKQALGLFVDGRASVVVGTHTHAPTADERILPNGTAYISDIGMCGDYNSVLGMDPTEPINRFLTKIPKDRLEPAMGPGTISGLAVETDDATGLARRIKSLRLGGVLEPTEPLFWVE